MKEGLNFVHEKMKPVKDRLKKKADRAQVAEMTKKIDDLEKLSKRNNVVIWNVPEGAERVSTCEALTHHILVDHMKLEGNLEVTVRA